MRRRTAALAAALALALSLLLPGRAGAVSGLTFLAIDDTLLGLDAQPYYGENIMVPAEALSGAGIEYTASETDGGAELRAGGVSLCFDTGTGEAWDAYGNSYDGVPALWREGELYVPVSFVCTFFLMDWIMLEGVGYGGVLRVKSGGETLSDSRFLNRNSTAMRTMYNDYYGIAPSPPPVVVVPVSPSPSPSPSPEGSPLPGAAVDRSGTRVYLAFTGLPTAGVLDALESYSVRACFFLTAGDVRESPESVRELTGRGHTAGVLLTGDGGGFEETAGLIFEAAMYRALLCTAPPESAMPAPEGAIYWRYDLSCAEDASSAYADISAGNARVRVLFTGGGGGLASLLRSLRAANFSLRAVRETY